MLPEKNIQTALVTGAGQGIGRAIALSLAAKEYVVFVNDINADRAVEVVAEIHRAGGKAYAKCADISKGDIVQAMITDIIAEFGAIDVLINNARTEPPRPDTFSHEEWWDCIFA